MSERKDRCENLEIKSLSVGEGQEKDERSGRPNLESRARPMLWKRLGEVMCGEWDCRLAEVIKGTKGAPHLHEVL